MISESLIELYWTASRSWVSFVRALQIQSISVLVLLCQDWSPLSLKACLKPGRWATPYFLYVPQYIFHRNILYPTFNINWPSSASSEVRYIYQTCTWKRSCNSSDKLRISSYLTSRKSCAAIFPYITDGMAVWSHRRWPNSLFYRNFPMDLAGAGIFLWGNEICQYKQSPVSNVHLVPMKQNHERPQFLTVATKTLAFAVALLDHFSSPFDWSFIFMFRVLQNTVAANFVRVIFPMIPISPLQFCNYSWSFATEN